MELEKAISLLKNIQKSSSALDEFIHLDLSLVSASERETYQTALKVLYKNIFEGNLSKEEARSKIFSDT